MNLAEHIKQKIFAPRLNDKRILVIYDAENRYQEICQSLASKLCTVIITEKKPVSSRMEAMSSWQALLRDKTNQSQLVIHCTEEAPNNDQEKRHHPFASYAALGASFPSKASDEYSEICRIFLPDRVTEINQLFEAEEPPTFDLIDNLLSGSHAHPHLQSIYDTADLSKIIPHFLVPRPGCEDIEKSLLESDGWVQELRQTVERTLGLSLNTQITNPATIRKKLWSYLLFSEFAADLPFGLPTNLADIPHGSGGHISFINSLCSDLRKHSDTKDAYRENADEVEQSLNLASECEDIHALGNTDTFSFEEKNFLHTACIAIRSQQLNKAKEILDTHQHSLWAEEGERSLLWRILELALDTLAHIMQSKSVHLNNAGSSGAQLCDTYRDEIVKVDKVFRELESATSQLVECEDEILEIIDEVRAEYRKHFNLLQQRFLSDVEREGWPFESMSSNSSTYNRLVAPALRNNKRVVYFHVDALRLDLAKDICQNIIGHKAQLTTTCAQLPCATKFAMASLLPDAENDLKFVESNEVLTPMLKDKSVATRSERMSAFKSLLSDRVEIYNLETFINDTKTPNKREDFVRKNSHDLLVVTSTEIDEQGEGASAKGLQFLPDIMRNLKLAIERCGVKDLNYDVAVIATDHGFIWTEDMGIDSTVAKPPGSWLLKKRRCLIGSGDNSPGTVKLDTLSIGIPTEQSSFIIPKALATLEFKQRALMARLGL